jgi:hypothetical protein
MIKYADDDGDVVKRTTVTELLTKRKQESPTMAQIQPMMTRPEVEPNPGEHDVKVFHVNGKANDKGGFAFAHIYDPDSHAFRVAADGLALMQVALHLSELRKAGVIVTPGSWHRVTLSRARRENSTFDFFGTLVKPL